MNTDRFKFRVWSDGEGYLEGALVNGDTGKVCGTGDYIIEQCTGLRDKNGKLIYEGDILGDEQPLRITVVWENIYWGYYADGSFHALPFWVNQLEIVGNIHDKEMGK